MNYSNLTQWCMKTKLRDGDAVSATGKTSSLPPNEPPVKPITTRTPPALRRRVRRRNRGDCLHYTRAAAVKTAAVHRCRWWNLSIHSVAESDFQLFQQFVSCSLLYWEEQERCFHDQLLRFLSTLYFKRIRFGFVSETAGRWGWLKTVSRGPICSLLLWYRCNMLYFLSLGGQNMFDFAQYLLAHAE